MPAAPRGQSRTAANLLKAGTRTILVADLRGMSPEDFAPISASPHNPVVIAIRDAASAGMVDALMLEGAIQALVDHPVESGPMLRAISDAARISSTADALSAVTPSARSSGGEEKSGKSRADDRRRGRGLAAAVAAGSSCRKASEPRLRRRGCGHAGRGSRLPPARLPPLRRASLDEVLEKARLAMDERRYIEPAKNNALDISARCCSSTRATPKPPKA
jgi:hypothetical protein